MSASSRNPAYEIDVFVAYYEKKTHLLPQNEKASWYMGARTDIVKRLGYTEKDMSSALNRLFEEYPELITY